MLNRIGRFLLNTALVLAGLFAIYHIYVSNKLDKDEF